MNIDDFFTPAPATAPAPTTYTSDDPFGINTNNIAKRNDVSSSMDLSFNNTLSSSSDRSTLSSSSSYNFSSSSNGTPSVLPNGMVIDQKVKVRLPLDKKITQIRSSSFHPFQRKVCIAFQRDIYEYDLVTGSQIAQLTSEQIITAIFHGYTHNILVAALENGAFCSWNLDDYTVRAYYTPRLPNEKKPISYAAVSFLEPVLFYARQGSRDINVIDFLTNSKSYRFDFQKRPISCIACHPTRTIIAHASIDGIVKITDTKTNAVVCLFEADRADPVEEMKRRSTSSTGSSGSSSSRTSTRTGGGSPVTVLSFHPHHDLLLCATEDGKITCWDVKSSLSESLLGSFDNGGRWITAGFFHPTLPCVMILDITGSFSALSTASVLASADGKKQYSPMLPFDLIEEYQVPLQNTQTQRKLSYPSDFISPPIYCNYQNKFGTIAFMGEQLSVELNISINSLEYLSFYGLSDPTNPLSDHPICSLMDPIPQFYRKLTKGKKGDDDDAREETEFLFSPAELYILDTISSPGQPKIISYSIQSNSKTILTTLRPSENLQDFHRCIRASFGTSKNSMLVFFETARTNSTNNKYHFLCVRIGENVSSLKPGMDGAFFGKNDDKFVILSEDGRKLAIYGANEPENSIIYLQRPATRVFRTPYDGKILFATQHFLALSTSYTNDPSFPDRLQIDLQPNKCFRLRRNEQIIHVYWQKDQRIPAGTEQEYLLGVLTTSRVMILSSQFKLLASVDTSSHRVPLIHSCLWVGNTLLYNTDYSVHCLRAYSHGHNANGHEKILTSTQLCTLDYPNSVLCGALNDRILFASNESQKKTDIHCRFVNMLEPLLMGVISMPREKLSLEKQFIEIEKLARRFDCSHVSDNVLDLLGREGYGDLGWEISVQTSVVPWELKYSLAKNALKFDTALNLLTKNYSIAHPSETSVPPSSRYFSFFTDLAQLAINYGQFEVAAKCFDMVNDAWALFRMFLLLGNTEALQFLSDRCQTDRSLYSIHVACCTLLGTKPRPVSQLPAGQKRPEFHVPVKSWPVDVERDDHDWEIGRKVSGEMKVMSQGEAITIDELDLTNLATWMGHISTVTKDAQSDWDKVDFDKEGFGTGSSASRLSRRTTSMGLGEDDLTTTQNSDPTQSEVDHDEAEKEDDEQTDASDLASETTSQSGEKPTTEEDEQERLRQEFINSMSGRDNDEELTEEEKRKQIRVKIDMTKSFAEDSTKLQSAALAFKALPSATNTKGKKSARTVRVASPALTPPRPPSSASNDSTPEGALRKSPSIPSLAIPSPQQGMPSPSTHIGSGSTTPTAASTATHSVTVSPPPPSHHAAALPKHNVAALNPAECLKSAMGLMEKGSFTHGLKEVNQAISLLVKDSAQILKKTNIMLCVAYKLALALLIRIRKMESNNEPVEHVALLTIFLTMAPTIPKHRVVCYKMAIKKNMEARNFSIAARIINDLIPLIPPQHQQEMEKRLAVCAEHGYADSEHLPPEAATMNVKFCWKTYTIIPAGANYLQCNYCNAAYLPSVDVNPLTTKCFYCTYGSLESKDKTPRNSNI